MLDAVELIPVDQIHVEDRLRSVNPDHAALIAESFRANGQMTPIEVRRDEAGKFVLVAGAHRLAAARLAEMDQIAASIIDADADQARLREIDENLCRRDLTELDRAAFLAERKVVWAKLNPEASGWGFRGGQLTARSIATPRLPPKSGPSWPIPGGRTMGPCWMAWPSCRMRISAKPPRR